jgi:hypothetical protein
LAHSRNPNGINVSMGIKEPLWLAAVSMSVSLLFLDVVAQAGDLDARVKGIANCTKAQVPA